MKKESLLLVGVLIVVGVLLGGILISRSSRHTYQPQASSGSTTQIGNSMGHIQLLQKMVEQTPRNRRAWVELGNTYFDSKQYMSAVQAYSRALELQPDDPDVLTDQGVMYRRLGMYDRAIANFKKAIKLDPEHQQSLYNLGVVYLYNKKDFKDAKDAWTRFLALSPSGPGADKVRQELKSLEALQPPASSH
ncbi:MAG TPA: tetratricopeptide repeat protein [Desulfuromonadales bacterium]|nr:tetratricopeptide repeat protein [Desulfuromonadales bacterium]